MKVTVDTGERIVVVVPSRLASSAAIAIEDDQRNRLVDVTVEDGLIGNVVEHVVRRHAEQMKREDRLTLWAHIVCKHASCIGFDSPLETLIEIHEHEHRGPGTIRNHDPASRDADVATLIHVLSEAESGIMSMTDSQLRVQRGHVEREIKRREDDSEGAQSLQRHTPIRKTTNVIYAGFFSVDESKDRRGTFTIFVNAPNPEGAAVLMRKQLEAQVLAKAEWLAGGRRIYLDSIIKVCTPAIVAYVSMSASGTSAIGRDVISGKVESWATKDPETDGEIEPFIDLENYAPTVLD